MTTSKSYSFIIARIAKKQLDSLPLKIQQKISVVLIDLQTNPFPSEYKKLKGYQQMYRIRVGDYRIIYSVDPKDRIIGITRIAHRKEVYKP